MDLRWPENFSGDRRVKATEELLRGRESTNRLQMLLGRELIGYGGGGESAEDLAEKILRSFTEVLAILNCGESDEVVSQVPLYNSPCSDGGRRSEESGESCKSPPSKDRRGSYKRRKTAQTWTRTTPNLVDDGHAWRKYGQKVILNAKHPRNYYRCTHKFDQGCQATKQVQKTEGEPAMYQITYNGVHTCRNLVKPPHLILDVDPTNCPNPAAADSSSSSIILSFESSFATNGNPPRGDDHPYPNPHHHPFFSSPTFPYASSSFNVKQEDYGAAAAAAGNPNNQSSSSDRHYFLSGDHLTAFESPASVMGLSPSDQGDVTSRTASTHSLDMDVMVGAVDFSDDVLQFDF